MFKEMKPPKYFFLIMTILIFTFITVMVLQNKGYVPQLTNCGPYPDCYDVTPTPIITPEPSLTRQEIQLQKIGQQIEELLEHQKRLE